MPPLAPQSPLLARGDHHDAAFCVIHDGPAHAEKSANLKKRGRGALEGQMVQSFVAGLAANPELARMLKGVAFGDDPAKKAK